jgi:hypothetical protein
MKAFFYIIIIISQSIFMKFSALKAETNTIFVFSSPDPRSGELLPSLGVRRRRSSSVVRCKLFQKSSPLKVQDQWKPNLV